MAELREANVERSFVVEVSDPRVCRPRARARVRMPRLRAQLPGSSHSAQGTLPGRTPRLHYRPSATAAIADAARCCSTWRCGKFGFGRLCSVHSELVSVAVETVTGAGGATPRVLSRGRTSQAWFVDTPDGPWVARVPVELGPDAQLRVRGTDRTTPRRQRMPSRRVDRGDRGRRLASSGWENASWTTCGLRGPMAGSIRQLDRQRARRTSSTSRLSGSVRSRTPTPSSEVGQRTSTRGSSIGGITLRSGPSISPASTTTPHDASHHGSSIGSPNTATPSRCSTGLHWPCAFRSPSRAPTCRSGMAAGWAARLR